MRILNVLAVVVLTVLPCLAAAETRALLVGVSDYDDDIGLSDLRGPANDVALLRDVLGERGVRDIAVLADGVEGAGVPTRAAILAALQNQADKARAGDLVYLHFSGHGTRQPDPSGDEADGLDEVFLPADTGRALADTGLIANALVDDEIGRAVDAIRAKGADVWLVLDSCHSGSGLRAGAVGGIARYVDPSVLGVTAEPARPGPAVDRSDADDLPGRYMAFYAARADEVARELDLDPGEGEEFYGLFSSKLAARLATSQGWSFRQLFQAVLSDLNDASLPGVAQLQTPSWDGSMIDAVALGEGDAQGPRRFGVRGDELAAGLVHNIGNATLLALYAGPADPEGQVLGFAQATGTSATRAYLQPVTGECVPTQEALCPRMGDLPVEARFAQVVARPVDLMVRISPPRDLTSGTALDPTHPAYQALVEAVETSGAQIEIGAGNFEVEVVWDGTALWFGRRAALGTNPAGLSWVPGGSDKLSQLLSRITQAEAFARLMDGLTGGGGLFNQNPVAISGLHLPSRVADLAPPTRPEPTRIECGRAFAAVNNATPVQLAQHSDLKQCDRLLFQGQGQTDGIRDVNILHIDAQYCVRAAHARVSGFSTPVQLGGIMNFCSDCPGGVYSAGDERVYVIVSEAARNGEALRLAGLVETCDSGPTRGNTAQAQLLERLGKMAQRPDTRGSFGGLGITDIWVERFDLTVLPREQVFRAAGLD